jgi:methionyl-tRNA synthetase
LADQEPWKIFKTDPKKVNNIIFVSLQISSILAIIGEPFLPFSSNKLKRILNHENHDVKWEWKKILAGDLLIKPGIRINEAELLFTKIEDLEIEFQLEKLRKSKTS